MSRHPFVASICFLTSLVASASLCSAQSLDVLYAQQNNSIVTYDVDPTTLQAARVGNPLALTGVEAYVRLIPSSNGHFVYILTAGLNTNSLLSVFATDASGVPQYQAVQTIGPAAISQFTIDPNGKFAYALHYSEDSQGNYTYTVRLFTIDAATGKLTESPKVQVQFPASYYCGPGFQGFYPNGSRFQYSLGCNYPDSFSATYYYRDIDSQTGDLGPATEIFSFNDNLGGTSGDGVSLSPISLNNLHLVNLQTSIRIFSLNGAGKPLIDCTSAMLPACGQTGQFWQDISGQYLLLSLYSNFELVKIDLQQKQIVDIGAAFSGLQQPYFSLDDRMIYGVSYKLGVYSTIQIYGFDPSTGGITTGQQIDVPATLWNVFPAKRD
jgi:hypothetical protein